MIYLYAIAEELEGLPDVRGLDGAPLDRRSVEGLDLVVSEHDGLKLELTGPWPPYNFVPEELARG